jgi:5-formyltetrahydrofolate cyclo-ligase
MTKNMENRADIAEQKRLIRAQLLQARTALPAEERRLKSGQICARICRLPAFIQADCIFGYIPVRAEVDVMPLLEEALKEHKTLALPRCLDRRGTMAFYQIRSFEDLVPGAFHIPEPREGLEEVRPTSGLMLVPGVGFDRDAGRLGYGGGYYDRFIGKAAGMQYIAPAYGIQITQTLPMEAHDAHVDLLITEEQIIERKYGG